jgi:hypothetical protein
VSASSFCLSLQPSRFCSRIWLLLLILPLLTSWSDPMTSSSSARSSIQLLFVASPGFSVGAAHLPAGSVILCELGGIHVFLLHPRAQRPGTSPSGSRSAARFCLLSPWSPASTLLRCPMACTPLSAGECLPRVRATWLDSPW